MLQLSMLAEPNAGAQQSAYVMPHSAAITVVSVMCASGLISCFLFFFFFLFFLFSLFSFLSFLSQGHFQYKCVVLKIMRAVKTHLQAAAWS